MPTQPPREKPMARLKHWRSGEPIPARDLDATNREIERISGGVETLRENVVGRLVPLGVTMFRYKSQGADHVVARQWDGATEASVDTLIAKPYALRNSITSRGGITYSYTTSVEREADDSSSTETQVVVPNYVTDDLIFAVRVPRGCGVSVGSMPAVALLWLDINVDARAWAKKSGT